jgi:hypothetical protein
MAEYDVFISYAHLDNRPFRPNEVESGWVSRFDYVLSNLLSTELGRPAKIWRDRNMDSNDYIWGTVEENMLKSLAFILVISPSYLNSKWCPEEVRTFIKRRPVRVGNKSLIFKVVKQPFEPTKVPEDLKNLFDDVLATDFFEPDQNSGKARIFNAEYGDKWEQIFYQKIDFLAQEIAELVEKAQPALMERVKNPGDEKKSDETSTLKPFQGMTIYLAEPSPDLWKDYLEIRRDFIKRGAAVLPSVDSMKPETIEEYEISMMEDLRQCKLVVHFIGSEDNEYSETNTQSLAQMQMSIAAKYQAEAGYKRLIWVPQNVAPVSESHRRFIGQLSEMTSRDVDLLRTPLALKTEMERILTDKPKPQAQPISDSVKPTVYVLRDNQDSESVKGLVDKLFENGCEVWTVSQSNESEGVDLIEEHKWYLLNCDAALVYWNKAPMFRVRAMMSEFQRSLDNGRERGFRARGIFIEGESPDKANFRTFETLVRNENDFSAYLAKLKNGEQNQ